MMLVFEDLHWADESLLDLVELLAARLRDLPILVLVLARPELLDSRPTWGGGLVAHSALPLRPLDAHEATGACRATPGRARRHGSRAASGGARAALRRQPALHRAARRRARGDRRARGSAADDDQGADRGAARRAACEPERSDPPGRGGVGNVFWRGALERMTPNRDGAGAELAELERRDLVGRQTGLGVRGRPPVLVQPRARPGRRGRALPRARRQERHREVARFPRGGERRRRARPVPHSRVTGATRATTPAPSTTSRPLRLPLRAAGPSTAPRSSTARRTRSCRRRTPRGRPSSDGGSRSRSRQASTCSTRGCWVSAARAAARRRPAGSPPA